MRHRLTNCSHMLFATMMHRSGLLCDANRVVKLWRESLSKVNQKAAESLADPTEYENLFPGLKEAFLAEQYLRESCLHKSRPATDYPLVTVRETPSFSATLRVAVKINQPLPTNQN